ncbi:hypothetical protein [Streptomyces sp. NPDC001250]|uniref:hypothetical protein n=1 Tax=unclassified Streptomyces TaxID=2593676 RepID=UPI00331CFCB6
MFESVVELPDRASLVLLRRLMCALLLLDHGTVFGLRTLMACLRLAEPLLFLSQTLLVPPPTTEESRQGAGLGRCEVFPAWCGAGARPVPLVETLRTVHTPQTVERDERVRHHRVAEKPAELLGLVLDRRGAVGGELRLLSHVGLLSLPLLSLALLSELFAAGHCLLAFPLPCPVVPPALRHGTLPLY